MLRKERGQSFVEFCGRSDLQVPGELLDREDMQETAEKDTRVSSLRTRG